MIGMLCVWYGGVEVWGLTLLVLVGARVAVVVDVGRRARRAVQHQGPVLQRGCKYVRERLVLRVNNSFISAVVFYFYLKNYNSLFITLMKLLVILYNLLLLYQIHVILDSLLSKKILLVKQKMHSILLIKDITSILWWAKSILLSQFILFVQILKNVSARIFLPFKLQT